MKQLKSSFIYASTALLLAFTSCTSSDPRLEEVIQYEKTLRNMLNAFEQADPDSVESKAVRCLTVLEGLKPVKGAESLEKSSVEYINYQLNHYAEYYKQSTEYSGQLNELYLKLNAENDSDSTSRLSPADSVALQEKTEAINRKNNDLYEKYYNKLEKLRDKVREAHHKLGADYKMEFKDIEFYYEEGC
jgi:hypothetical protein